MASRHAFCFASPPRVYAQPSGRSQSAKLCQTSTRTPSKQFSQPPARLLRNSTSERAAAAARTRHLPGGAGQGPGVTEPSGEGAKRRAQVRARLRARPQLPAPSRPIPAPPRGLRAPAAAREGRRSPGALGARPPHSPPLAAPCPRRDAAVTAPSLSPSLPPAAGGGSAPPVPAPPSAGLTLPRHHAAAPPREPALHPQCSCGRALLLLLPLLLRPARAGTCPLPRGCGIAGLRDVCAPGPAPRAPRPLPRPGSRAPSRQGCETGRRDRRGTNTTGQGRGAAGGEWNTTSTKKE